MWELVLVSDLMASENHQAGSHRRFSLKTGAGFQPAGENRPTLELTTVISSYGTITR